MSVYTYTHLACLVRYAEDRGTDAGTRLLHEVFSSIESMLPTKSANDYWQTVSHVLLNRRGASDLWREEKIALLESIEIARAEALRFLAEERQRIMKLSRQDAIREVLVGRKLDARISAVKSVSENSLLDIGDSG